MSSSSTGTDGSAPLATSGLGLDERVIVAAALELLEEHGVEGLTMRALAERLGGSVGAAYKHVASKHDLLRLVTLDLFARAEAADRPDAEPLDRVRLLLLAYRAALSPYSGLAAYMSTHMEEMAPIELTRLVRSALVAAGFRDDGPERAMRVLFFYTSGALLTLPAPGPIPKELLDEWFEDGLGITLQGLRQELSNRTS